MSLWCPISDEADLYDPMFITWGGRKAVKRGKTEKREIKLYFVILQDPHAWMSFVRFNPLQHCNIGWLLLPAFHALIPLPPVLQTKSWRVTSNSGKAEYEVISTQRSCTNWWILSFQILQILALIFLSLTCLYMTESYFKTFFRPWYVHQMYRNWRTGTPFHDSRYLLSLPWLRYSS